MSDYVPEFTMVGEKDEHGLPSSVICFIDKLGQGHSAEETERVERKYVAAPKDGYKYIAVPDDGVEYVGVPADSKATANKDDSKVAAETAECDGVSMSVESYLEGVASFKEPSLSGCAGFDSILEACMSYALEVGKNHDDGRSHQMNLTGCNSFDFVTAAGKAAGEKVHKAVFAWEGSSEGHGLLDNEKARLVCHSVVHAEVSAMKNWSQHSGSKLTKTGVCPRAGKDAKALIVTLKINVDHLDLDGIIEEANGQVDTLINRIKKDFSRKRDKKRLGDEHVRDREAKRQRSIRGIKKQEQWDSRGINTMLSRNDVHQNSVLLELAQKFERTPIEDCRKFVVNFSKSTADDDRFYYNLYTVDTNPKKTGKKPMKKQHMITSQKTIKTAAKKKHELGTDENAELLLNQIMNDIENKLQCPGMFKRLPYHLLEEGDYFVNEVGIVWGGIKIQAWHQDCNLGVNDFPESIRDQVKSGDHFGPLSGEYALTAGIDTVLHSKVDNDETFRTIRPGHAFLFSYRAVHAGGKYLSHVCPRFHFHVDVKGVDRANNHVNVIL